MELYTMTNTPSKPDYTFAFFVVYLLYFLAAILFFTGLSVAAPALNGNNVFQYTFGVYGVALMVSSIFILAIAQLTKASLDTATYSWHIMNQLNSTANETLTVSQAASTQTSDAKARNITDPAYQHNK